MTMQHFYIIIDTETINSLTRLNCDYVTDLKIDEQIKEPVFVRNVTNYDELESGTVNIIDDNLNEILRDLIEDKQLPKVKYSSLTTVSKIDIINKNGDKIILVNPGDNNLTVDEIKLICNKAGIIFNNQSIGNLLADIQKEFYKPKREIISKELKELIFKEQCGKCADCNEDLIENFELDHIQPVSGGGSNEREN